MAYALLSGADGWMFDGEDALGQVSMMSLDNQRSLKLAHARDPVFLEVAQVVAGEMNAWAQAFFGRPIIQDWRRQLDFTTAIFRARGLHLDERHVRMTDGTGFSAAIVDAALYTVHNHQTLRGAGRSIVLYLPKIQNRRGSGTLARHPRGVGGTPGPASGYHQGLCPGRAGRGELPAHGDPRGPR